MRKPAFHGSLRGSICPKNRTFPSYFTSSKRIKIAHQCSPSVGRKPIRLGIWHYLLLGKYAHPIALGERCEYSVGPPESVFQTGLPFRQGYRGFENPRLFKDRPTDGAALVHKSMRLFLLGACRFMQRPDGMGREGSIGPHALMEMTKVTRVSLSDCFCPAGRVPGV